MPSSGSTQETFYAVGLEVSKRTPLSGQHRFDAVVVGAGYAGVSAALTFAEAGMSVIVLEKDRVASGASGRNGGILLLSEGTHLADPEQSSGVDDTLGAAAQELFQLMEEHKIDADARRGSLRLAITSGQAKQLAKAARSAGETTSGRSYLDQDALREHIRSDRYVGGLHERDNIALNPHRLLEGLASLAERRGAVIAEDSEVVEVQTSSDSIVVRTAAGEVKARRMVVAAGAGTGKVLSWRRQQLMVGFSQIAVTDPIPADLLESVLPSWVATSEIATFSRYFRRLPDNRLLFGISTLFESISGDRLEERIRRELRDTFPALGDVLFNYSWEGEVASTIEETPLLDRIAPSAVVTSSNGVLPSWNTGRIAAQATDPRYASYDVVRSHRHRSWPPLGLPDTLVRRGAKVFFALKDRI